MMKKLLALLLALFLIGATTYVIFDEELPVGMEGAKAEAMADQMLKAVNHEAWTRTGAVEWDFGGRHHHVWDRERHLAKVSWGEYEVLVDINKRKGLVTSGYEGSDRKKASEICLKAWRYWANDSFWLNPVSKVRDDGTTRSLVKYDGEEALLITYNQGGVTPGDSYLWFLDETGLPVKWKMWVKIIPLGGISTTWEGWVELSTGAKVATSHYNLLTLKLEGVKAAGTLIQLKGEDIFSELVEGNESVLF